MTGPYCPKRGDVVWLSLTPQAGREQAGHRPALALSPEAYNDKVGLAVFCPIRSKAWIGAPATPASAAGSQKRL